ncbi:hypothetical protein PR048_000374 [Dryococelus australis]|uniref:Uncharacterized protein n=1 Tax=Dryococelus australis TaxID=614101 RepID=A0ABQ9IEH1_9NEOP|nr:hypothetical protein PR048_000374 [Dryococelus australis]
MHSEKATYTQLPTAYLSLHVAHPTLSSGAGERLCILKCAMNYLQSVQLVCCVMSPQARCPDPTTLHYAARIKDIGAGLTPANPLSRCSMPLKEGMAKEYKRIVTFSSRSSLLTPLLSFHRSSYWCRGSHLSSYFTVSSWSRRSPPTTNQRKNQRHQQQHTDMFGPSRTNGDHQEIGFARTRNTPEYPWKVTHSLPRAVNSRATTLGYCHLGIGLPARSHPPVSPLTIGMPPVPCTQVEETVDMTLVYAPGGINLQLGWTTLLTAHFVGPRGFTLWCGETYPIGCGVERMVKKVRGISKNPLGLCILPSGFGLLSSHEQAALLRRLTTPVPTVMPVDPCCRIPSYSGGSKVHFIVLVTGVRRDSIPRDAFTWLCFGAVMGVVVLEHSGVSHECPPLPNSNETYCCGKVTVHRGCRKLFAFHLGEPGSISSGVLRRFLHMGIMPDDVTGRLIFSGISLLPNPIIFVLLHTCLYVSFSANLFLSSPVMSQSRRDLATVSAISPVLQSNSETDCRNNTFFLQHHRSVVPPNTPLSVIDVAPLVLMAALLASTMGREPVSTPMSPASQSEIAGTEESSSTFLPHLCMLSHCSWQATTMPGLYRIPPWRPPTRFAWLMPPHITVRKWGRPVKKQRGKPCITHESTSHDVSSNLIKDCYSSFNYTRQLVHESRPPTPARLYCIPVIIILPDEPQTMQEVRGKYSSAPRDATTYKRWLKVFSSNRQEVAIIHAGYLMYMHLRIELASRKRALSNCLIHPALPRGPFRFTIGCLTHILRGELGESTSAISVYFTSGNTQFLPVILTFTPNSFLCHIEAVGLGGRPGFDTAERTLHNRTSTFWEGHPFLVLGGTKPLLHRSLCGAEECFFFEFGDTSDPGPSPHHHWKATCSLRYLEGTVFLETSDIACIEHVWDALGRQVASRLDSPIALQEECVLIPQACITATSLQQQSDGNLCKHVTASQLLTDNVTMLGIEIFTIKSIAHAIISVQVKRAKFGQSSRFVSQDLLELPQKKVPKFRVLWCFNNTIHGPLHSGFMHLQEACMVKIINTPGTLVVGLSFATLVANGWSLQLEALAVSWLLGLERAEWAGCATQAERCVQGLLLCRLLHCSQRSPSCNQAFSHNSNPNKKNSESSAIGQHLENIREEVKTISQECKQQCEEKINQVQRREFSVHKGDKFVLSADERTAFERAVPKFDEDNPRPNPIQLDAGASQWTLEEIRMDKFHRSQGVNNKYECHLEIREHKPFIQKPYPIAYALRTVVEQEVQNIIETDNIERRSSEYANPTVVTQKASDKKCKHPELEEGLFQHALPSRNNRFSVTTQILLFETKKIAMNKNIPATEFSKIQFAATFHEEAGFKHKVKDSIAQKMPELFEEKLTDFQKLRSTISAEMVTKSFKFTGISNEVHSVEDGLLWEDNEFDEVGEDGASDNGSNESQQPISQTVTSVLLLPEPIEYSSRAIRSLTELARDSITMNLEDKTTHDGLCTLQEEVVLGSVEMFGWYFHNSKVLATGEGGNEGKMEQWQLRKPARQHLPYSLHEKIWVTLQRIWLLGQQIKGYVTSVVCFTVPDGHTELATDVLTYRLGPDQCIDARSAKLLCRSGRWVTAARAAVGAGWSEDTAMAGTTGESLHQARTSWMADVMGCGIPDVFFGAENKDVGGTRVRSLQVMGDMSSVPEVITAECLSGRGAAPGRFVGGCCLSLLQIRITSFGVKHEGVLLPALQEGSRQQTIPSYECSAAAEQIRRRTLTTTRNTSGMVVGGQVSSKLLRQMDIRCPLPEWLLGLPLPGVSGKGIDDFFKVCRGRSSGGLGVAGAGTEELLGCLEDKERIWRRLRNFGTSMRAEVAQFRHEHACYVAYTTFFGSNGKAQAELSPFRNKFSLFIPPLYSSISKLFISVCHPLFIRHLVLPEYFFALEGLRADSDYVYDPGYFAGTLLREDTLRNYIKILVALLAPWAILYMCGGRLDSHDTMYHIYSSSSAGDPAAEDRLAGAVVIASDGHTGLAMAVLTYRMGPDQFIGCGHGVTCTGARLARLLCLSSRRVTAAGVAVGAGWSNDIAVVGTTGEHNGLELKFRQNQGQVIPSGTSSPLWMAAAMGCGILGNFFGAENKDVGGTWRWPLPFSPAKPYHPFWCNTWKGTTTGLPRDEQAKKLFLATRVRPQQQLNQRGGVPLPQPATQAVLWLESGFSQGCLTTVGVRTNAVRPPATQTVRWTEYKLFWLSSLLGGVFLMFVALRFGTPSAPNRWPLSVYIYMAYESLRGNLQSYTWLVTPGLLLHSDGLGVYWEVQSHLRNGKSKDFGGPLPEGLWGLTTSSRSARGDPLEGLGIAGAGASCQGCVALKRANEQLASEPRTGINTHWLTLTRLWSGSQNIIGDGAKGCLLAA